MELTYYTGFVEIGVAMKVNREWAEVVLSLCVFAGEQRISVVRVCKIIFPTLRRSPQHLRLYQ
jgi:hypothetical protein